MKRLLMLLACCWAGSAAVLAQVSGGEASAPSQPRFYSTFPDLHKKHITDELLSHAAESAQTHPEFGVLPYNAPCENCVELTDRRTPTSRYFIENGSGGNVFYMQQSARPMHYEADGQFITLDPHLGPDTAGAGRYRSRGWPWERGIDVRNHYTWIKAPNGTELRFNQRPALLVERNGTKTPWQPGRTPESHEAGSDGVLLHGLWPDADSRITFKKYAGKSLGGVKVDYLLHSPAALPVSGDSLVIADTLHAPGQALALSVEGDMLRIDQAGGRPLAKMMRIRLHDASLNKTAVTEGSYEVKRLAPSTWVVYMKIGLNWLLSTDRQYPITIDPTVILGTNTQNLFFAGSGFTPTYCTNTMNFTIPGGSMPFSTSFSWAIETDFECTFFFDCWLSEQEVFISSSCGGRTPTAGNWICAGLCNGPGTWTPTINFGESGTNSMAQCYTPSCNSQTVEFTFHHRRTFGPDACGPDCSASNFCSWLNDWTATIQGRTVEVLGSTAGDGSTTDNTACGNSTTLDPNAQFGVGPYSYTWNTGGTGSTENVSVGSSPDPVTVDVTDACGETVQATFNFANTPCTPLPVELLSFEAEPLPGQSAVDLSWVTASEQGFKDFVLERGRDPGELHPIDSLPAQGGFNGARYDYRDELPPGTKGRFFYRLRMRDLDGSSDISALREIVFSGGNEALQARFTAKGNRLELRSLAAPGKPVRVHDLAGQDVLRVAAPEPGQLLDTADWPAGVYLLRNGGAVRKLVK